VNFSIGVPARLRAVRNGKQLWSRNILPGTHNIEVYPGTKPATFEFFLHLDGAPSESQISSQTYTAFGIAKHWLAKAKAVEAAQSEQKIALAKKAIRLLKGCLPESASTLGEAYAALFAATLKPESQKGEAPACHLHSPQERDRNLASTLSYRAHQEAEAGNVELARALIPASRAFIAAAGEKNCHASFVLFSAQTAVASKLGQRDRACRYAAKAFRQAKRLYGDAHHDTMLALANSAEVFIAIGKKEEAKSHLATAIGFFRNAPAAGRWDVKYMQETMVPALQQLLASAGGP
jgi:tetratricopeptide (TPR) repeat protein